MYSIGGPDGPVYFETDSNGYVVKVSSQEITAGDSPLVVTVDPPIGPIDSINFGTLYLELLAILNG